MVALEFRNQEASVLRHARLAGAAAGTATSFDSEWEHQLQIWIGELNAQRSSIDTSFQKVFFSNIPGRSGGCVGGCVGVRMLMFSGQAYPQTRTFVQVDSQYQKDERDIADIQQSIALSKGVKALLGQREYVQRLRAPNDVVLNDQNNNKDNS